MRLMTPSLHVDASISVLRILVNQLSDYKCDSNHLDMNQNNISLGYTGPNSSDPTS